jgi:hypothetical protein
MAFEKTVKYRTPDGVEHESVDAAKTHAFALHYGVLGQAISLDFEKLVASPTKYPALRDALREVYLRAFPRANTGKPRPRKAKETPALASKEAAK